LGLPGRGLVERERFARVSDDGPATEIDDSMEVTLD